MFYSWINATCHPAWLGYFNVKSDQLPTIAFYYPEKENYGKLIGAFDRDTILDQQNKFLKGKLAMFKQVQHDLIIF